MKTRVTNKWSAIFVILSIVVIWGSLSVQATVLEDFVYRPDDTYGWEIVADDMTADGVRSMHIEVTSQSYQGEVWKHRLFVVVPPGARTPDATLMYISASGSGEQEVAGVKEVAKATNSPMAALMDIPNQPIFDGLREDAAIAHTFQRFVETGDPEWPLLLPMVKGAIRSMDALQEVLKDEYGWDVAKFVLSGASKRGWTTWLAGAIDPRVVGIAPAVYNNLNLQEQINLHAQTYSGAASPKIHDYTDINLHELVHTDIGYALSAIVDPYAYIDRLTMPKMLLHGTNDPYWPVDALNVYYDELPGTTYVVNFPNGGHDLGDMERLLVSLGVFFTHTTQRPILPEIHWDLTENEDGTTRLTVRKPPFGQEASLWLAISPSRDFTNAAWIEADVTEEGRTWFAQPNPLSNMYVAFYIEVRVGFTPNELFRLDTPIFLLEPSS